MEEEEEEEEDDDDNDDDDSDDDDDDNVDIDERALRVCEELGFSKKHIDSIVEGEECVKIDDDGVDDDGGGAVKHYKLKKQKMKMLLDLD